MSNLQQLMIVARFLTILEELCQEHGVVISGPSDSGFRVFTHDNNGERMRFPFTISAANPDDTDPLEYRYTAD